MFMSNILIMFTFLNQTQQKKVLDEEEITKSCRQKYPHMIPVKVQVQQGLRALKQKFLISEDVTGIELQRHVLKYIEREVSQGLYFFIVDKCRHRMLQANVAIKEPYGMYKNESGVLRVLVMKQNAF